MSTLDAARVTRISEAVVRRTVRSYRRATAATRLAPDVLIIGAQRGGTTSLHSYLVRHPGVMGASVKEVHYFDNAYRKGDAWYLSQFPRRSLRSQVMTSHGLRLRVVDTSPYYLFHPHAPARARAFDSQLQLIAILRDPVDRALSHHAHGVALGTEHLPFEEALAAEPARVAGELDRMLADPSYRSAAHQRYTYLARGRYAEQLEAWLEHFRREQLLILRSEDLFSEPAKTVGSVFDFLGLPRLEADHYPVHNAERYQAMNPTTQERLTAYYEEPNRRLKDLFGIEFDAPRR